MIYRVNIYVEILCEWSTGVDSVADATDQGRDEIP